MSGNELRPVIIKKKKVVAGGGHHGGAWKVAYADFVTAMMAFFMLMWLLNATTEKQRKGIADYFSPTIAINRISGGGDGAFGGDSVFSENTLAQNGTGATNSRVTEIDQARGPIGSLDDGSKDESSSSELEQAKASVDKILTALAGESDLLQKAAKHVITRVTDEGLVIDLFDLPGEPIFVGEEPQPIASAIANLIQEMARAVTNPVSVGSHVQAQPIVAANNSVWDQSTQRAAAFRGLLVTEGMDEQRIARTTGFADRRPVVGNPMASRNNRIEIIFLRRVN